MRRALTSLTAVAALALAGCGSESIPATDGGSPATEAAPREETEPATGGETESSDLNERGNVTAALGQPVTVTDPAGNDLVEVTVESVTVDYPCDGPESVRQEPANGHYLGVAMTIRALTGLSEYENPFGDPGFSMSGIMGSGFSVVGPDGFTEDGVSGGYEAYTCSADNNRLLIDPVLPGQNYQGVIVLDSANTSGTLIWTPTVSTTDTEPGYEWTF